MKRIILLLLWLLAISLAGFVAWNVFQAKNDEDFCRGDMVVPENFIEDTSIEAVNHLGQAVTSAELVDGLTLLYFGYTFCPDICPVDIVRLAEVKDILTEKGIDITPIFISIDPERDTPEEINNFVTYTHKDMIGLTGSKRQIDKLTRNFHVTAQKNESEDEFYTITHTAFFYLIDENGFISMYDRSQSPEEVADAIACHAQKLGK